MTHNAQDVREVTLLEVLDRVIDRGVVLAGDITISVADVDLVYLGLRLMLCSVLRAEQLHYGASACERRDL